MARGKSTSKARNRATASSVAAETAPNDTPTLFPPGDCVAGLPANPIQHDITFAELKKLERTIDQLPYSIVLPPRDVHKLPPGGRAVSRGGTAAARGSVLDLIGGVPIESARSANVNNLKASAVPHVELRSL